MKIKFNGIKGEVIESSPHGNYLIVKLSERISICGTYSNVFSWEEIEDISSGFISFITYIGVRSKNESILYSEIISELGGYFKYEKDKFRKAKRIQSYPYEMKIRGLQPDGISVLNN